MELSLHWPDRNSQSQHFYQFFPLICKLHLFWTLAFLNSLVTITPASSLSNCLFQAFLKSRAGKRSFCVCGLFWEVIPKSKSRGPKEVWQESKESWTKQWVTSWSYCGQLGSNSARILWGFTYNVLHHCLLTNWKRQVWIHWILYLTGKGLTCNHHNNLLGNASRGLSRSLESESE